MNALGWIGLAMTPDEALKVAEEALDHSHVDDCDCEDCAALAALARLREELPKLAMVRNRMASKELWNEAVQRSAPVIGVAVSEIDEWHATLSAILARLEEGEGT